MTDLRITCKQAICSADKHCMITVGLHGGPYFVLRFQETRRQAHLITLCAQCLKHLADVIHPHQFNIKIVDGRSDVAFKAALGRGHAALRKAQAEWKDDPDE